LSVITHIVCMTAINGARPMVSGTKMKVVDGGDAELPP
jgi:hypothetical protein